MGGNVLIYGSYGYTGELIVQRAFEMSLRPILGGRSPAKLTAQAEALGLDYRVFRLERPDEIQQGLAGMEVVLHVAGPYAQTSRPMVAACLREGVHYLDLTGEVPVYAEVAGRDAEARAAGVMLLPGAGFDITPSDCLAAHLKLRLPEAHRLTLAWRQVGPASFSRGTAKSLVEMFPRGCYIRREGRLETVPFASRQRLIDFGRGPVQTTLLPWADVFTAFYSTGIPNIEVYSRLHPQQVLAFKTVNILRPLMRLALIRRLLKRVIDTQPAGPTPAARQQTHTLLYGEVEDQHGGRAVTRLSGAEAGYTWTPQIAIALVNQVLGGNFKVGYQTPARVYGSDFIQTCGGSAWEDVI